ncbi:surfeit locus protein 1 [Daktulosphaira vitifoliae]|uniref:surfeit locus protein 1 n=1 Tax=Daktulosphaira vitifoliae TaxID=58002 RepID=UPI0021AA13F1|nr:surfeit locus protein 1 [Daktulosphaira vitifoliae]
MLKRKIFLNFYPKKMIELKLINTVITKYCASSKTSLKLNSFSRRKNNNDIGWILLVIPISAFGLGTWQIKRKIWKESLIDELKTKTTLPAIDFPEDIEDIKNLEYCRIKVKGEFDHSKEIFLGPRSCLVDGGSSSGSGLFSVSGYTQSGYNVITPFKLSDKPLTILVNRGWVSMQNKNSTSRMSGQVSGEVELEGIVRLNEPRPQFVTKNVADSHFFSYRDLNAMSKLVQSEPILIDVVSENNVPGGPLGGQTNISLRNEHLSYIITWYGLAAATSYMWYSKYSHAIRMVFK